MLGGRRRQVQPSMRFRHVTRGIQRFSSQLNRLYTNRFKMVRMPFDLRRLMTSSGHPFHPNTPSETLPARHHVRVPFMTLGGVTVMARPNSNWVHRQSSTTSHSPVACQGRVRLSGSRIVSSCLVREKFFTSAGGACWDGVQAGRRDRPEGRRRGGVAALMLDTALRVPAGIRRNGDSTTKSRHTRDGGIGSARRSA